MLPQYPSYDVAKSTDVLDALGTFWSTHFTDKDILKSIFSGRLSGFDQSLDNIREAETTLGLDTLQPFHSERVLPITVTRNMATGYSSPVSAIYSKTGAKYGIPAEPPYDSVQIYGGGLSSATYTVIPIPKDVIHITHISNRVMNPTVLLTYGVDFVLDFALGAILINRDLFADDRIDKKEIYDPETGTFQTRIKLYATGLLIDKKIPWTHFGYILNFELPSSEYYVNMIRGIYSCHNKGPSVAGLIQIIAGNLGVPYITANDVVEVITSDNNAVVTGSEVCKQHPDANILVSVGDAVSKYQLLGDTLQFIDIPGNLNGNPHGVKRTLISSAAVSISQNMWSNYKTTALRTYRSAAGLDVVGTFGNETLTLNLQDIPDHDSLKISMDLIVCGAGWKGNGNGSGVIIAADGNILFAHNLSNVSTNTQTYPVAGSNYKTGAIGSSEAIIDYPASLDNYAVYRTEFNVTHTIPTLELIVTALGVDPILASSYSLYNVKDTTTARFLGVYEKLEDALTVIAEDEWSEDLKTTLYTAIANNDTQTIQDLFTWEQQRSDSGYALYPASFWAIRNLTITRTYKVSRKSLNTNSITLDPSIAAYPGIVIGTNFSKSTGGGSILFRNAEVAIQPYVASDGVFDVKFEVGGIPSVVEAFWDTVHANGVASGYTLAQYLDIRDSAIGQPSANSVPATINPMLFILHNVFRYNLFMIRSRSECAASDAPGTAALSVLRDVLAPHVSFVALSEVDLDAEDVVTSWGESISIAGAYDVEENVQVDTIGTTLAPNVGSVEGSIQ